MNLPIFRDLYKLNVALLKDIENIPKIHRHTLGNRIIDTGLSSLHQLQKAYDSTSPVKRLYEMSQFSTELATLTTYLRMAGEYYFKYEFSACELIDTLYMMILKLKKVGAI